MKAIVPLVIAVLTSASCMGQSRLEIVVKNLRDIKGSIRVGLFTNKQDFLKNAVEGKVITVTGDNMIVVFDNLKPGDYALSIIHDENDNGKLDMNFIGMPKEGFAFGNNAMGAFGPPSFSKSKVNIQGSMVVRQEISMRYL
jgi:uncharacterized protein (DUF2141 family)